MSNSGANFESLTKGQGLSLKVFGAKWDGITDDSKALEKAIENSVENNGSPILLPEGTGVINSIPQIPKNLSCQIPIKGAGMLNTKVKLTEALRFTKFQATSKGDTIGNIDFSDFTVDGNNQQVSEAGQVPVVVGSYTGYKTQVNVLNVKLRRIRTINIPILDKEEGGRRNVILSSYHEEPGLALNKIENIDIRECEFSGGQYGVYISGEGPRNPYPWNIRIRNVYLGDSRHIISSVPTEKQGFNAHFQVGQSAWSDGANIVLERLYGENSGDVGIEMDVAGVVRDCLMVNCNNAGYLFNTFNCATTQEPIVTKTVGIFAIGSTNIKVSSSSAFTVGEKIVFFGTKVSNSEVRTIKAKPDSEHIELSEATGIEWASGTWIQQIDDMSAVQFKGYNLKYSRTQILPGSNRGLQIQNIENVLPSPEVDIDGYSYYCNTKDISGGEVANTQYGTANSPSGAPKAIRIKKIKVDRQNLEYSGAETKEYTPISLNLLGTGCPVDIQGELNFEGVGNSGAGKLKGKLIKFGGTSSAAVIDIDILTKWIINSSGGERWAAIVLNEAGLGDITGRIRHRTRASEIKSGGGVQTGIRIGKACAMASKAVTTTLNTAELAKESTVIPVKSTEGFAIGQAVILDSLSTTKSEIVVIKSIEAGVSLTMVSVGATPGTTQIHTEGATIAPLKPLVVEDSDWFGLGTSGVGIGAEDENIFIRMLTRGNVYPSPPTPVAISFPGSTKAFQIVQKGQSGTLTVESGTVTAIEWSADGSNFFKYATATGAIIHVSTGDFVKVTDSVEPTIKFIADRN